MSRIPKRSLREGLEGLDLAVPLSDDEADEIIEKSGIDYDAAFTRMQHYTGTMTRSNLPPAIVHAPRDVRPRDIAVTGVLVVACVVLVAVGWLV